MPCDTQTLPGQTLSERKAEVREAIDRLSQLLIRGKARIVISRGGAIAFSGWEGQDRGRVSDACAYRLAMVGGSAILKAKIAQAEQIAGRAVNRAVVNSGVHSHDSGRTWSSHK